MTVETDFESLQLAPSTIGQKIGFWIYGFFASLTIAGGITILYIGLSSGSNSRGQLELSWLYVLPLVYIATVVGITSLYRKVRHRAQSILVANIALLLTSIPTFYMAFKLL